MIYSFKICLLAPRTHISVSFTFSISGTTRALSKLKWWNTLSEEPQDSAHSKFSVIPLHGYTLINSAVYGEALTCSTCVIYDALLISGFWKLDTFQQQRLCVSGKTLLGHSKCWLKGCVLINSHRSQTLSGKRINIAPHTSLVTNSSFSCSDSQLRST